MKKVFFTAFAAMAFAFTMTACGGNTEATDSTANTDTTAVAVEEEHHCCAHEADSAACCQKAEGQECEHKCQK